MTTMTTNRKQRLRTLENRIRKNAESIGKTGLEIGLDLIEIREEELWEGHESWGAYLKKMADELVGKSFAAAAKLIRAAEISKKLPSNNSVVDDTILSPTHLTELGRLAPTEKKPDGSAGVAKDFSKLKAKDVTRVLEAATKIAGSDTPSVRDVRQAVDHDLGIDRAAKAKATKEKNAIEGIELADYMRGKIGQLEAITDNLAEVSADGWELLEDRDPGLAIRLATACDELAGLLRS